VADAMTEWADVVPWAYFQVSLVRNGDIHLELVQPDSSEFRNEPKVYSSQPALFVMNSAGVRWFREFILEADLGGDSAKQAKLFSSDITLPRIEYQSKVGGYSNSAATPMAPSDPLVFDGNSFTGFTINKDEVKSQLILLRAFNGDKAEVEELIGGGWEIRL
jgi:hypothetical protein